MKRNNIFYPNWRIIILAIAIYIINILIILQLIPVLEGQSFGDKAINLIVSPPNFFFEDLLGISSVKAIDLLTWILQFVYDYIISAAILYFIKGGKTK